MNVPRRGGYSAGGRDVSELPAPPPSVTAPAEVPAGGRNPRIRQCAAHLAAEFHATHERKRVPAARIRERYDWNELPGDERALLVETFYSLVYRGIIACPVTEHRIGISLREDARTLPARDEHNPGTEH